MFLKLTLAEDRREIVLSTDHIVGLFSTGRGTAIVTSKNMPWLSQTDRLEVTQSLDTICGYFGGDYSDASNA